MSTHFPTVPVEMARQKAPLLGSERVRPLALVVGDEPVLAETLTAILIGSGLSALTAKDSAAAMEMALLMPPDILIAELACIGIDGIELGLQIRQAVSDCDVILFTEQVSSLETLVRLRAAGPDFLTLTKPVHPADLLEQVFRCLRQRGFPNLKQPALGVVRSCDTSGENGLGFQPHAGQEHILLKRRTRTARGAN